MKIKKSIFTMLLIVALSFTFATPVSANYTTQHLYLELAPYIEAAKEVNQELGSEFSLPEENYQHAYDVLKDTSIIEFKNSLRSAHEENSMFITLENNAISMPTPFDDSSSNTYYAGTVDYGNGTVGHQFRTKTDKANNVQPRYIYESVWISWHI